MDQNTWKKCFSSLTQSYEHETLKNIFIQVHESHAFRTSGQRLRCGMGFPRYGVDRQLHVFHFEHSGKSGSSVHVRVAFTFAVSSFGRTQLETGQNRGGTGLDPLSGWSGRSVSLQGRVQHYSAYVVFDRLRMALVSPIYVSRQSLKHQRSNAHSNVTKTKLALRARTQVRTDIPRNQTRSPSFPRTARFRSFDSEAIKSRPCPPRITHCTCISRRM